MSSKSSFFNKFRSIFTASQHRVFSPRNPFNSKFSGTALLPIKDDLSEDKVDEESVTVNDNSKFSKYPTVDLLKKWGCSHSDISFIYNRRPSLRNSDIDYLHYKLNLLTDLGITSSDLVKILKCRPRFLSCRINKCFDERIDFLIDLFGSRETFIKALVRNPSLLTYDLHLKIKPIVALYEELGLTKMDLSLMLVSRPTLIPRTSIDDMKMEYIRRTGVTKESKMYKYIVTIIAISRIETIREKIANFEKFGFTEEEGLLLVGRSPLILTLSVDKVQRNMTFILGTMKFEASLVLQYPFLLYFNLENVLKPRFILGGKIQEMGLEPQIKGDSMIRALRMTEKRFVKVFVSCHPKDVANELMECYRNAKSVKRLAEASKKKIRKGFPF